MTTQARHALAVLVGQPFWYIGRAVDMAWMGFGSLRRVRRPRGGSAVLGRFALHLQCPWRITTPQGILVGNYDIYTPASTAKTRGWKWDKGPNLFDARVGAHLAQSSQPLAVVRSIVTDRCGGFRLAMTHKLILEVFPASSQADEYAEEWRFFRPGSKAAHFVMSQRRLRRDE